MTCLLDNLHSDDCPAITVVTSALRAVVARS